MRGVGNIPHCAFIYIFTYVIRSLALHNYVFQVTSHGPTTTKLSYLHYVTNFAKNHTKIVYVYMG